MGRLASTRSGSAEGGKGVVIIFPAQFGVAKDYDEVRGKGMSIDRLDVGRVEFLWYASHRPSIHPFTHT